eukprot:TRINITY_DN574_c0_g1_i8.p1 TRINITY_DN574_c0_g1~~TRINITY_DN574_c0_g1_i8.p1  ORF type:complete len:106 (-),score=9.07 TRINITY_DN574_c0_g1_i8:38-355(-)
MMKEGEVAVMIITLSGQGGECACVSVCECLCVFVIECKVSTLNPIHSSIISCSYLQLTISMSKSSVKAFNAASRQHAANSAPVNPDVSDAICFRSTSEASGVFLV